MSRTQPLLESPAGAKEFASVGASHSDAEAVSAFFSWPVSHMDPNAREEVIRLVQRLFLGPDPHRVIVFCGAERSVGCSWLALQTAGILTAHQKGPVCLVDANLRSPSLHSSFGLPLEPGLADASVVRPVSDFVRELVPNRAFLLPAGKPSPNPLVTVNSDSLKAAFRELRSAYQFVIVDAAPANEYADVGVFGQFSDGVVLVIAANSTRAEHAYAAKQKIQAANTRVLGAVLNRRKFPIPRRIYWEL